MRSRLVSYGVRAAVGTTLASLIACGMASSESLSADRSAPNAGSSDAGGSSAENTAPSSDAGQGAPVGKGMVVVHAAAFPSFRLCFKNHLSLKPQPDSKVMPEANVVGAEVGSVVRIEGLDNPGTIYVINRRQAAASPDSNEPACKDLICQGGNCLIPNNDYFEATPEGEFPSSIGTNRVDALAITGCGPSAMLAFYGYSSASCGNDWSDLKGNLKARVVALTPSTNVSSSLLPIQLVHFAPMLEQARGNGVLDVSFGDLSTANGAVLKDTIETNPVLYKAGTQKSLGVDKSVEATYGKTGFRIALRPSAGATATFSTDLTLAAVQELSSPSDVPSAYYKAASNYALLLLGDPAVKVNFPDGGPNQDFERRSVHILAVPILEPKEADAGVDGGGSDNPPTGDGG